MSIVSYLDRCPFRCPLSPLSISFPTLIILDTAPFYACSSLFFFHPSFLPPVPTHFPLSPFALAFSKCRRLGIEGTSVKRELLQQVVELPSLYADIAADCQRLDSVLDFYRAFLLFLKVDPAENDFLPILRHVLAKGGRSVRVWVFVFCQFPFFVWFMSTAGVGSLKSS